MKENFPNLAKEIDIPVQEAQRVPKNLDPRGNTPRHIIIKLPKIKDKERILKAARKKGDSYLQRSSHKTISRFLKRNFADQKGLVRSSQSDKKQGTTSKITGAKLSFKMEGQIKCFPDMVNLKEFVTIKPLLQEMLKGLI